MSWKQIKLGDLFEQYRIEHMVQNDRDYGQITISKNGYIKFRTTKNGKSIGRKRQFIINLDKYPNTLLFTRQGVADGAIGFAPKEVNNCIATENMPMFSLKDGISKTFVELILKSEQYISEVKKLIPTGSAQKSIHERDLMQISLYIPDEKEQKKLSAKIDVRLNGIQILSSEIDGQLTLLKKLRQSILQEAIEGKLTVSWREQNPDVESASVLLKKIKAEKEQLVKEKKIKAQKPLSKISEDEIPFDIPDSWEWCKIGDITQVRGGKRVDNGYKLLKTPTPYIYLRVSDMKILTIDESDLHYIDADMHERIKHYIITNDDLYMVIVGGTIGKCGIVPTKFNGMNLTENAARITPFQANKFFLLNCFIGDYCQKQFIDKTKSVGVQKMALNRFQNTLLPFPPLEEQKEIVKKIENLFKICDELEVQINSSKINSQTLMQAVLKEAFEK